MKAAAVLTFGILLTLAACGGGGPRMTVEEYAAACEALDTKLDELTSETFTELDVMEHAVAEAKSWNPPEELQEFHDVRARGSDVALNLLKDSGFFELMQDLEKAQEEEDAEKAMEVMAKMAEFQDDVSEIQDQLAELEQEAERTRDALSPTSRQILADADCL